MSSRIDPLSCICRATSIIGRIRNTVFTLDLWKYNDGDTTTPGGTIESHLVHTLRHTDSRSNTPIRMGRKQRRPMSVWSCEHRYSGGVDGYVRLGMDVSTLVDLRTSSERSRTPLRVQRRPTCLFLRAPLATEMTNKDCVPCAHRFLMKGNGESASISRMLGKFIRGDAAPYLSIVSQYGPNDCICQKRHLCHRLLRPRDSCR